MIQTRGRRAIGWRHSAAVGSVALTAGILCGSVPSFSWLRAEEPPATAHVARLVRSLGSDSYLEREKAGDELARAGTAAREHLEEALASDDPEIRLRAKELLRKLKVQEIWSPALVSYQARDTLASSALAAIAEQTGNRVLVGDQYGTFRDQPIELEHAGTPFWAVVDELCRQSGNRVRPHYDTRNPGLVLVAGSPGSYPVAYAGPLRAQLASARRVFSEELDYERLETDTTHTFQFDLQVMWEDRFKLVAYRAQPQLVRAVTDTGVELAPSHPTASGWNVAGSAARQLSMSLRLEPPSTAARELEALELEWGLIAAGDMAQIEIERFDSKEPFFQDDVELVVDSFQQGPGPRCEMTLLVVRDLVLPEPQEVIFQENEVELVDTQGRPYRRQGQSNSLTEQGARLKLTFIGQAPDSVPKLLRFSYPRIRAQNQLKIVFRNVPLPVGRPQ